jgi:hypothetical protein
MQKLVFVAAAAVSSLLVLACSASAPPTPVPRASDASAPLTTAEDAFLARAKGTWLYEFQIDGANGAVYVKDYVEIDRNKHNVSADIYADKAYTTKLFHLEWSATLAIPERSAVPNTFKADIRLRQATFAAFVDDPALWAAFGVDDCKLVVNQAVDVMQSNCVYPLTRNTTCTELDLFELLEGSKELRIGVSDGDHCGKRPTEVDRVRAPYLRQ